MSLAQLERDAVRAVANLLADDPAHIREVPTLALLRTVRADSVPPDVREAAQRELDDRSECHA